MPFAPEGNVGSDEGDGGVGVMETGIREFLYSWTGGFCIGVIAGAVVSAISFAIYP